MARWDSHPQESAAFARRTALEVIVECYARAESGFGFSLTKEEAVIVGVLLDLHEQQIQLADRAQLALALVEGYRRVTKAALYEFQVDLSKQASDAQ